ncbi:poly-gamma-glutamate system protein [Myxococcota bacterium]
MRRVYWRNTAVSRRALTLIAFVAVASVLAAETLLVRVKQPWFEEKMQAAQLCRQAMEVIKQEKLKRGYAIDAEFDPAATGLIGLPISPVTSNTGHLNAKQISANPNFAAVVVHLLQDAGVGRGDVIAIEFSGSFPSLNMATYAAVQVLGLEPIAISGASASQYGANYPEFVWLDMERVLFDRRVFRFRSRAASRGGVDDRGLGMSRLGRGMLDRAIARNQQERIDSNSLMEAIDRHKEVYDRLSKGRPVAAFINVGGAAASVGTFVGKRQFKPGLNRRLPRSGTRIDSVMARFAGQGVPVIHLTQVAELAERYGLALEPTKNLRLGDSRVFVRDEYSRWLAGAGLALVLALMLAIVRLDVGVRLQGRGKEAPRA